MINLMKSLKFSTKNAVQVLIHLLFICGQLSDQQHYREIKSLKIARAVGGRL